MDSLKTLEMNGVPLEFWYACTIILAGVLVWVIKDFVTWLRVAIIELKESVNHLKSMVEMHTEDIRDIQKEMKENRNRPRR